MYIVNLEIQLEIGNSKIFRKFYSFAFKLFALSMHLGEKIHFLSDITGSVPLNPNKLLMYSVVQQVLHVF